MAREQSPAFQFYPQDFLADDKVMAMTATARGCYIVLLCHCWLNHELPDDPKVIRRLSLYDGHDWPAIWGMVKRCFFQREGMLIQPRIERERAKQAQFRDMKARAGQAGGKQKASNALADTLAKASPPSSSSSSSSTQVRTTKKNTSAVAERQHVQIPLNGQKSHRPKRNLSVITKIAHTVIDQEPHGKFADLKEAAKEQCAKAHIRYDAEVVGAALESAIAQRRVQ